MEEAVAAGAALAAAMAAAAATAVVTAVTPAAAMAEAAATAAVTVGTLVAVVSVTATPAGMTPPQPKLAPASSRSLRTRTALSFVRKLPDPDFDHHSPHSAPPHRS